MKARAARIARGRPVGGRKGAKMTAVALAAAPMGRATQRKVLRMFNSGLGVKALAAVFASSEAAIQALLDETIAVRGCTLSEPRPVTTYAITAERLRTEVAEHGEALPKFANHAAHVALVMAEGGFGALTERVGLDGKRRLGLPLIFPVYPGAAPAKRRAAR